MKIHGYFYMLIFFCFSLRAAENEVVVRPAKITELPEILALDRKVSFEYFKPLFLQYPNRSLGKDADAILEEELRRDEHLFPQAIAGQSNEQLYVACIDESIVGLTFFSLDSESMAISLILVDKEDRDIIREKIVKHLLDMPHVCSYRGVSLGNNRAAVTLWESLGFTLLSQKPDNMGNHFPADSADAYRYYEYTKDLSSNLPS